MRLEEATLTNRFDALKLSEIEASPSNSLNL